MAWRMKRSTSRSIAVTISCRPFSDVTDSPNAECASVPASRASTEANSSLFTLRAEVGVRHGSEIHVDPHRLVVGTYCMGVDMTRSDTARERGGDEAEIDPLARAYGHAGVFPMASRDPCVDEAGHPI